MAQRKNPIVECFGRLVSRDPGAPLVVSTQRVAAVSRIDQLARGFEARLGKGDWPPDGVMGLIAPDGPGFLAALLALRRCGIIALVIDHGTPFAEQERIARGLGAPALLTVSCAWPESDQDWTITQLSGIATPTILEGVGVVKLTSGSTGKPRGIAVSEEALVWDSNVLNKTMGITTEDRILSIIPMSHSYGLSILAVSALTQGTVLILPESHAPYEPFLAAQELGATVFPTVPAFLQGLLRLSEPPPRPADLRLVISASAPLPPATAIAFREQFGLPVHVFYGASECGGICYDREGSAGERGTVGTPVHGVDVVVDTGHAADADGPGTVVVKSSAVANRYVPDEDPDLVDGCFRSKDLAQWRDGELVLVGRREDWINVRGRKVNPREVEAVLEELSGIEDAVVFGFSIPGRGGEGVRAVVAGGAEAPGNVEVLSWCRSKLVAHKVPRSLLRVAEIPRTSRGKLDWPAIRKLGHEEVTESLGN